MIVIHLFMYYYYY